MGREKEAEGILSAASKNGFIIPKREPFSVKNRDFIVIEGTVYKRRSAEQFTNELEEEREEFYEEYGSPKAIDINSGSFRGRTRQVDIP